MKHKVLSLLQPWASLVVMGAKQIETRSWNTKYRGPLLIHASQGQKKAYQNLCADEELPFGKFIDPYSYLHLPFGAIIGSVNLVDTCPTRGHLVRNEQVGEFGFGIIDAGSIKYLRITEQEAAFGDYSFGRYGWLLSDPVIFKDPIPAKGKLGIWEWEGDLPK